MQYVNYVNRNGVEINVLTLHAPTDDLSSCWVRLHALPRKVGRTLAEFRSPKQRWLAARSAARFADSDHGRRVQHMATQMLHTGSIGRVEGFTFTTTETGRP